MKFTETRLQGAYVVDLDRIEDSRGFLAHVWNREEFAAAGLATAWVHSVLTFNHKRGTVRGMHYQADPHGEVKLVRCIRGRIHDVIIDLRRGSPTFKQWVGVELSAENRRMLYVPLGFAHGYQTLEDGAEVFYLISESYHAESARSVRPSDPAFGIAWPLPIALMSERDSKAPDFKE